MKRDVAMFLCTFCMSAAFIEDIFEQAFGGGGGGGGFQFQMGGDMFGRGNRKKVPSWPRGYSDKISKEFNWLKGTEWNWNSWRNVKFEKDGSFDAPTPDCSRGQCKWAANKGKVFILWGEAGVHELQIEGGAGGQGKKMSGFRVQDRDKCSATFVKIFDHEAAELDKDLYDILGLQDDADEAQIKKVYRKLSVKYHPDKNPDEESRRIFNEVRDAYEILNDPDKKILYDTGGMEAVKGMEKGNVQRGDDIESLLHVSLEDLYNSQATTAAYSRRIVCRGCRVKPDSPKCRGCSRCPNEVRTVHRQVGAGMYIQQQEEVSSKEKCKNEDTVIDVQIEKGMREGEKLTFPRMSEQRPGMIPGDVALTLRTEKHRRFKRRGDDLHIETKITLREALLGWTQTIKHLDGHIVEFSTESVTSPFQVIKLEGEGMPLRDDPSSFGDLYLRVEVTFPSRLTAEQVESIGQVFMATPPRQEL